jgi:hypothetical protein
MKCILCGKTSEIAFLSPETRRMFKKQFPNKSADEIVDNSGVCPECLILPLGERKNLAARVVEEKLDEHWRNRMMDALMKRKNGR